MEPDTCIVPITMARPEQAEVVWYNLTDKLCADEDTKTKIQIPYQLQSLCHA